MKLLDKGILECNVTFKLGFSDHQYDYSHFKNQYLGLQETIFDSEDDSLSRVTCGWYSDKSSPDPCHCWRKAPKPTLDEAATAACSLLY